MTGIPSSDIFRHLRMLHPRTQIGLRYALCDNLGGEKLQWRLSVSLPGCVYISLLYDTNLAFKDQSRRLVFRQRAWRRPGSAGPCLQLLRGPFLSILSHSDITTLDQCGNSVVCRDIITSYHHMLHASLSSFLRHIPPHLHIVPQHSNHV
jgi:hypothetical protein